MTISELILECKLQNIVKIPDIIKNFEVKNENEFCRIAEINCLKSDAFKDDLIDILSFLASNNFQVAKIPLEHMGLLFAKDNYANLHLIIAPELVVFY